MDKALSASVLCLMLLVAAARPASVVSWGDTSQETLNVRRALTNVVSLSDKGLFSLALRSDGTVFGWGEDFDGALEFPADSLFAKGIAAGGVHSLILTTNGTVEGFGGYVGALATPPYPLSNVIAVAAGGDHSLALQANGTVVVWGSDNLFQTDIPPNLSNIIAIAAGYFHSLAVDASGHVYAWGDNQHGQLDVPNTLSNAIAVAGGIRHSVALTRAGDVVVWGSNEDGEQSIPAEATNIVAIDSGGQQTMALRADGHVFVWGNDEGGTTAFPEGYTNCIGIAAGVLRSFALTLMPVFTFSTPGTNVAAGSNVELTFEISGSEPVITQWEWEGHDLLGETNPVLKLKQVQLSDAGNYRARVRNTHGTIWTPDATLVVSNSAPFFNSPPLGQELLAGTNALFSVDAGGSAPIQYQWQLNGVDISDATDSTLLVTNISEANQGDYQVVIRNSLGEIVSSGALLTVDTPPSIAAELVSQTVAAGTNYIMRTTATGDSPIFYQWQFQGTDLPNATNASLLLTNIQPASAGVYSVRASNRFGESTRALYSLNVVGSPPGFLIQPASQGVIVGQTVKLRALAFGSTPLFYQWWHGSSPIIGATDNDLTLAGVSDTDLGRYSLTVSNIYGDAQSSIATLDVRDPYPGQLDLPNLAFMPLTTSAFSQPIFIAQAGDRTGRLFVLEAAGRVLIVQSNTAIAQPFLDIGDRVSAGGMLSMAFPPGFATNGHFYVNYVRKTDFMMVVSRFSLGANSNLADPNSEEVVKLLPGVGVIAFGPDGYLYISVGLGGTFYEAQDPSSFLGKLLRLDVESGAQPYAIPPSNPFVGNAAYAPEIWALGLCEVWPFTFDRLTGDLYAGDARPGRLGGPGYQEIEFQPSSSGGGRNYGWPFYQTPFSKPSITPTNLDPSTIDFPVTWYTAAAPGLTGGYVYRGPAEPRMTGVYFFADVNLGTVWALKRSGANWYQSVVAQTKYSITSFGEDEPGHEFIADYSSGKIFRLEDTHQVLTPSFEPMQGVINSHFVRLNCASPGALIHFTTDGRDPTEFDPSVVPGDTIEVLEGSPVKIQAFRADLDPSPIATATFTFAPQVNAAISNGVVLVQWGAVFGRNYQVQTKTDLKQASWVSLKAVTATGPTASYSDKVNGPRRFYRVVPSP